VTEPIRDRRRPRRRRGRSHRGPGTGLRTVREYSAGGLVVDGLDRETQVVALIRTVNRGGRKRWTVPKGHIEVGEKAEEAAIREIAEETGIYGEVLAPLGISKYWFRAQDQIVHKTVHHYLLRFVDGELCAGDHEVAEVAWVPLDELPSRFSHPDERELGQIAARLVAVLRTQGREALPPLPHDAPRRRPQTHSIASKSADPAEPRGGAPGRGAGQAT
jgi:ADP-ribose pyrophosphatase YjhB (NUDIX family)